MRLSLAAGLISLSLLAKSALAMQFQPTQVSSTELVVEGSGPIVPGDTDRLLQVLADLPRTGVTLLALALDSPGGFVVEAKEMVGVIRARQLPVVIPSNGRCASACFLLFAAAPRRFAATDALVGVHSANEDGVETRTSLAVTTLMARDAADLGVPASIVGKMVETTPEQVAWLDPHDLSLMGVTIYNGDALAALRQADPSRVQPDPPAPVASSAFPLLTVRPASPAGAAQGHDDRRGWDAWVGGLHGAYRDGANFAKAHMDETRPDLCYGPNNLNRGDFTLGCDVGRRRLATVVAKLRASADYAAGWNAPVSPLGIGEPVLQLYQGVYFCARYVVHFTLKMFQTFDETHRRGLFVFGPGDNSPDVPNGSFIVEGAIDLAGGKITLMPVKWVLQPAGYSWFGLRGESDDGGKTFGGRLTESESCTRFTLAQLQRPTASR